MFHPTRGRLYVTAFELREERGVFEFETLAMTNHQSPCAATTTPQKFDCWKDSDAKNDNTPATVSSGVDSSFDEDVGKYSVHHEHDESVEISLGGDNEPRNPRINRSEFEGEPSPSTVSVTFSYSPDNIRDKAMSDVTSPGFDRGKSNPSWSTYMDKVLNNIIHPEEKRSESDDETPSISSSDARDQVLAVSVSETAEWQGSTWDAAVAGATTRLNVVKHTQPDSGNDRVTFDSVLSKLDRASSWFDDVHVPSEKQAVKNPKAGKSTKTALQLVCSDTEECTIDADPTRSEEFSGAGPIQAYLGSGSYATPYTTSSTRDETTSLKSRDSLSFDEARAFFEKKDTTRTQPLRKATFCSGMAVLEASDSNDSTIAVFSDPLVPVLKPSAAVKEIFDEVLFELVMKVCDKYRMSVPQYPQLLPSLEVKKYFDAVIEELLSIQKVSSKVSIKTIFLPGIEKPFKGVFERELAEVQTAFGSLQEKRRWKQAFDPVLAELKLDVTQWGAVQQKKSFATSSWQVALLFGGIFALVGVVQAYWSYSGAVMSPTEGDGKYTPQWLLLESGL